MIMFLALLLISFAAPALAQVPCAVVNGVLTCPAQTLTIQIPGYTAELPPSTTTTIIQSVPSSSPSPSGFDIRALIPRVQYKQPGSQLFDWAMVPPETQVVAVRIHGAGSSGGGSPWIQFGGGGGSGGYIECLVPRASTGSTSVMIGAGGARVPAGIQAHGVPGGDTSFGPECVAHGSPLGGQQAYGPSTGGDGGSGGYGRGAHVWFAIPGGQGDASPPQFNGVNMTFPRGASAPHGATGGNNWQCGLSPGGGGAPGNNQFPSGCGGDGWIEIYW